MKQIDEKVLSEMTRRLVLEFNPEQVILFGSHAWGAPDEDSDVDLFVIVTESDMSPARRAQRAHGCLRDIAVPKDILVRTRQEAEKYRSVHASLEALIFEKGKELYGRH
jgi:predicted nucleotidyltransferase